jgi:hypothetical protein
MCHHKIPFANMPVPLRVLAIAGFAIVGLLIAATLALLFGLVLMWLWNWLMPAIFGLPVISFWQAWGLVVLSHILFKTFPHHDHKHHQNEHWKSKFREKFREHKWDPEKDKNDDES